MWSWEWRSVVSHHINPTPHGYWQDQNILTAGSRHSAQHTTLADTEHSTWCKQSLHKVQVTCIICLWYKIILLTLKMKTALPPSTIISHIHQIMILIDWLNPLQSSQSAADSEGAELQSIFFLEAVYRSMYCTETGNNAEHVWRFKYCTAVRMGYTCSHL